LFALGMKLFRRGSTPSDVTKCQPMQQVDLDAAMKEVSSGVEPWDSTRIVLVKPLQDAARNHGQVQLMRDTANGDRLMAVKRMPSRWVRSGPKEFDEQYPTASEKPWHDLGYVQHLGSVHFPYVCDLHGIFRSEDETFVATSFCTEGDLFGWCDNEAVPAPSPAREEHMRPIIAQVFAAVRWLHDLGIAHRDLSLENILLVGTGADARVKVIDFGMATLRRTARSEVRGKASYQAPEMHTGGDMDTFLSDIFALGVVIFAMAAQDYPWTCTKRGKCQLFEYVHSFGLRRFFDKRRLRKGNGEYLVDVFTPGFIEVIDTMLNFQPKQRGCVGEVTFQDDVRRKRRPSVWDLPHLKGADAALPKPGGD